MQGSTHGSVAAASAASLMPSVGASDSSEIRSKFMRELVQWHCKETAASDTEADFAQLASSAARALQENNFDACANALRAIASHALPPHVKNLLSLQRLHEAMARFGASAALRRKCLVKRDDDGSRLFAIPIGD